MGIQLQETAAWPQQKLASVSIVAVASQSWRGSLTLALTATEKKPKK